MEKCSACNSSIKRGELACYSCGAPVQVPVSAQSMFGKRFAMFLTLAFGASALLTLASLFVDFTPPFMRCLSLTLILLLIRSSAVQMMDKKRD
jgi:hypothetical protein